MNSRLRALGAIILVQCLTGSVINATFLTSGIAVQTGHDKISAEIELYDQQRISSFFNNGPIARAIAFVSRKKVAERAQLASLNKRLAVVKATVQNSSDQPIYIKQGQNFQGFEAALVDPTVIAQSYPSLGVYRFAGSCLTMFALCAFVYYSYTAQRTGASYPEKLLGHGKDFCHNLGTLMLTEALPADQCTVLAKAVASTTALVALPIVSYLMTRSFFKIARSARTIAHPALIRPISYEKGPRHALLNNGFYLLNPGEQLEEYLFVDTTKAVINPTVLGSLKLMWSFDAPFGVSREENVVT